MFEGLSDYSYSDPSSQSELIDDLVHDSPDDDAITESLRISEPPHIKGKGRPKGTTKSSIASRKLAFENSTQRLPSSFELAEARIADVEEQRIGQQRLHRKNKLAARATTRGQRGGETRGQWGGATRGQREEQHEVNREEDYEAEVEG